MKSIRIFFCIAILLIIYSSCSDSSINSIEPQIIPEFTAVQIDSNQFNSLSAKITASILDAEEVYLKFSYDTSNVQQSPAFFVEENNVTIPLLGLKPNTNYSIIVIATSSTADIAVSDTIFFTSGDLPNEMPQITTVIYQTPSQQYVMIDLISRTPNSKGYAIIINNDGDVVWYREFSGPVVDFQKQPNGNYTVFTSENGATPRFYEINSLGEVIREFVASNGFETDPHEIRLFDGGYCLFNVEVREMDLTLLGGYPNVQVTGTNIEFIRSGQPAFYWSPFDYFQVTDAASDIPLNTQNVDPWHGNALEIDTDGNLLASFRNSDEITKINSQTGEVIWRLGGKQNEFTFINDPLGGFSHQHGIRRLENGNLIMFDNGNLHSPPTSRAVEYKIDEQNKTAELVWDYTHMPAIFSFAIGFAQRLPDGNTLIDYGTANKILEVDMLGNPVMEIAIQDSSYVYRAFRINSIY